MLSALGSKDQKHSGEVKEIFYPTPLYKNLLAIIFELEAAQQFCFFLSKNSGFGYSEELSDIKLGAINMFIFQQLCCTKRFRTWFSPICRSDAAAPMQAKPSIKTSHVPYFLWFMIKIRIYTIT